MNGSKSFSSLIKMRSLKEMVLIVSIFSACVLTILATFFAVLNQKAIGDGALYSLQSATIFTDMAACCGWDMHTVPKVRKSEKKTWTLRLVRLGQLAGNSERARGI